MYHCSESNIIKRSCEISKNKIEIHYRSTEKSSLREISRENKDLCSQECEQINRTQKKKSRDKFEIKKWDSIRAKIYIYVEIQTRDNQKLFERAFDKKLYQIQHVESINFNVNN